MERVSAVVSALFAVLVLGGIVLGLLGPRRVQFQGSEVAIQLVDIAMLLAA